MFEADEREERRRKRRMAWIYGLSLGFHLVAGVALAYVKVAPPAEVLDVEITEVNRPKPEPKPEPEPEPEPAPVPKVQKAAPPAPAPEAAPAEAAPEFGLTLSAGGGPGGIAVPTGPAPAPAVKAAPKALTASAAPKACVEPDTKPKPVTTPRPTPTDDARAAAIVGKVRVHLTVDATGAVIAADVVEGLGHGLDEAALAAVKAWKFEPATHCGKPVQADFTVGLNFNLSK